MLSARELRNVRGRLRRNPTKSEKIVLKNLEKAGERFLFQPIVGFYVPDFILIDRLTVLEVDGISHENKVLYDLRRDSFLVSAGFKVVRIKNKDAKYILDFLEDIEKVEDADRKLRSCLAKANSLKSKALYEPTKKKKKQKKKRKKLKKKSKSHLIALDVARVKREVERRFKEKQAYYKNK